MVLGMNGRNSGDSRRGGSASQTKKERAQPASTEIHQLTPKVKPPSAEQVSLASMLGDKTSHNISDLVSKILAVVRRSEEDIIIALHDHDYDVGKTIEALLDSSENTQEEWMVMSGKKGRKSKQSEAESDSKGKKPSRTPDTRGAAKHTRESYGGHVTVEHTSTDSGTKSQRDKPPRSKTSGSSGGSNQWEGERNRRNEGRRENNERENRRDGRREHEDRGGESSWNRRDRRRDPEKDGGSKRRDFEEREGGPPRRRNFEEREGGPRRDTRRDFYSDREGWSRRRDYSDSNRRERAGQHDGRRDNRFQTRRDARPTEQTHEQLQLPGGRKTSQEEHTTETTGWGKNTPPSASNTWSSEEWVMVDPPQDQSVFPDALETTATSSLQEDHSNFTEEKRSQSSQAMLDETTQAQGQQQQQQSYRTVKSRRFKSSQIPSQPVEMPCYSLESLKIEIGALGIDFVGSELTPTTTPTSLVPAADQPAAAAPSLLLSPNQLFSTEIASTQQQTTPSLLTSAHYTSSFTEDTAVIAISTNLSSSFNETPPTKLDPPPGLTHPSQQQPQSNSVATATSGLLPPPQHESLSMASPQSSSNKLEELLTPSTSSYSLSLTSAPVSLEAAPSFSSVSTAAQTEPLFSSQPMSVSMVTNPASSHHGPPTTASIVLTSLTSKPVSSSHSGSSASKVHGGVMPITPAAPTGMMYPPHMLHQFPPYGTTPVMIPPTYTHYDVETLNRYQGFYGQHQASSDAATALATAGGAAGTQGITARDHSNTAFGGDTKYDMTSPVGTANHTTQQQQGTHFYNPYYYTLYAPPLGMAAAAGYSAQMNHKAGAGSNYPTGTSYQQSVQGQYATLSFDEDSYSKLYPGGISKSNSTASTAGVSDFAGYSKQQYDNKATGYGNYVPQAMSGPPMGGYMMAPPPMMTPHDSTSHSKHSKYGSGWGSHTHKL